MIGFCDDDDYWMPSKLTQQVALWRENPEAAAISSGITVRSGGQDIVRLAPERATFADFLRSRITEIHPSAMLYSREDLLGVDGQPARIGLVDEELPAAYGEDYDLLLRATRHGDVMSVPEPLILVLWDRPSFFSGKWQSMVDGLSYILRKFPEFEQDPKYWHVLPVRLRTLRRLWATTRRRARTLAPLCAVTPSSFVLGQHTLYPPALLSPLRFLISSRRPVEVSNQVSHRHGLLFRSFSSGCFACCAEGFRRVG